jgi:hypothetical protein
MRGTTLRKFGAMLVVAVVLALSILARLPIPSLPNSLTDDPVVLVIGDFSSAESFGSVVLRGVRDAQKKPELKDLNLHIERVLISEPATVGAVATSPSDVRSKLLEAVAAHNVVAVISANTSQSAGVILDAAHVLNIPVLLTVATNDSLLTDLPGVAYRLPARDSLQADAITSWCERTGTLSPVGIIYDPRRYGTDLKATISAKVGELDVMSFPIGSDADVGTSLDNGMRAGIRHWVVLGYREQALEVMARKVHMLVPGPILFSDGAYGLWLSRLKQPDVYLSFPIPNASPQIPATAPSFSELGGYATFGHDAYVIVANALIQAIQTKTARPDFRAKIAETAKTLGPGDGLTADYEFDQNGENIHADFGVYEVGNGKLP